MIILKKTTQQLLDALKNSGDIKYFFNTNKEEFINSDLAQYLNELLAYKDIDKARAIEKANLNTQYGYQIFAGQKNPSRDKLLQLAFGMSLDLKSTRRLLNIAGASELYPRNRRDSIIIYAINNSLSLMECEELLEEMGEYTIQ